MLVYCIYRGGGGWGTTDYFHTYLCIPCCDFRMLSCWRNFYVLELLHYIHSFILCFSSFFVFNIFLVLLLTFFLLVGVNSYWSAFSAVVSPCCGGYSVGLLLYQVCSSIIIAVWRARVYLSRAYGRLRYLPCLLRILLLLYRPRRQHTITTNCKNVAVN